MLKIDLVHLGIVRSILAQHLPASEVWAFGSRVHGKNFKKFSDLDLVICSKTALSAKKLGAVKQAFSESNLPFKVDVSEWLDLPESLKKVIAGRHEVIQKKSAQMKAAKRKARLV